MKISNILLWTVLVAVIGWLLVGMEATTPTKLGSVTVGNEYNATSTSHLNIASTQLIKGGQGTLGSVVITGVGTAKYTLYDATSTDFSTNTLQHSSTSSVLAVIPASLAVGDYVFDIPFRYGLLLYYDTVGGSATWATSTITYR